MGTTIEVQPGRAWFVNSLIAKAQMPVARLSKEIDKIKFDVEREGRRYTITRIENSN